MENTYQDGKHVTVEKFAQTNSCKISRKVLLNVKKSIKVWILQYKDYVFYYQLKSDCPSTTCRMFIFQNS